MDLSVVNQSLRWNWSLVTLTYFLRSMRPYWIFHFQMVFYEAGDNGMLVKLIMTMGGIGCQ